MIPPDGWSEVDHKLETHYAIPPNWNAPVPAEEKKHARLTMEGTSFREKDCRDDWCLTKDAIKWSGPGEEGVWIDPKFKKHKLNIKKARSVFVE